MDALTLHLVYCLNARLDIPSSKLIQQQVVLPVDLDHHDQGCDTYAPPRASAAGMLPSPSASACPRPTSTGPLPKNTLLV